MLKAQLDLSVSCPHTQDFEPCMGPGCSDEGEDVPGPSPPHPPPTEYLPFLATSCQKYKFML